MNVSSVENAIVYSGCSAAGMTPWKAGVFPVIAASCHVRPVSDPLVRVSVDEREQQQPGDEHADDDQRDGRRLRTLLFHGNPLTIRTAKAGRAAGSRC